MICPDVLLLFDNGEGFVAHHQLFHESWFPFGTLQFENCAEVKIQCRLHGVSFVSLCFPERIPGYSSRAASVPDKVSWNKPQQEFILRVVLWGCAR